VQPTHNLIKRLLTYAILICPVFSQGQTTEISLKLSAAKLLQLPGSNSKGFAYKINPPFYPYPAFHIEISKTNILKASDGILGISLTPTFSDLSVNEEKINILYNRSSTITFYSFQFFAGIDKNLLVKDKRKNRNTFSISGGFGFNLSGNWKTGTNFSDGGTTFSGENFSGTHYTIEKANLFSPIVFIGGRFHVLNKKGKEVLVLELGGNCAIDKYYAHTLRYQIDGTNRVDYIAEKGFSIQFSLVKRIISFGGKK